MRCLHGLLPSSRIFWNKLCGLAFLISSTHNLYRFLKVYLVDYYSLLSLFWSTSLVCSDVCTAYVYLQLKCSSIYYVCVFFFSSHFRARTDDSPAFCASIHTGFFLLHLTIFFHFRLTASLHFVLSRFILGEHNHSINVFTLLLNLSSQALAKINK